MSTYLEALKSYLPEIGDEIEIKGINSITCVVYVNGYDFPDGLGTVDIISDARKLVSRIRCNVVMYGGKKTSQESYLSFPLSSIEGLPSKLYNYAWNKYKYDKNTRGPLNYIVNKPSQKRYTAEEKELALRFAKMRVDREVEYLHDILSSIIYRLNEDSTADEIIESVWFADKGLEIAKTPRTKLLCIAIKNKAKSIVLLRAEKRKDDEQRNED